ncbi:hypothetical protein GCM10011609_49160 [Lentzea pudingi]|uniref:Uncharacterized protein n=1 Tax=Lentzea pudingi TaxID=1789439 RepID=A0ABQ2IDC2_9PSEU|nr:hypothetical protein GCM10011609_49160 [Lentzea pudingi]
MQCSTRTSRAPSNSPQACITISGPRGFSARAYSSISRSNTLPVWCNANCTRIASSVLPAKALRCPTILLANWSAIARVSTSSSPEFVGDRVVLRAIGPC